MILIYTPTITPRIAYAMELVFNTVLSTEYKLTTDIQVFNLSNEPKISYSNTTISPIHIFSHTLLFEGTIENCYPIADLVYTDFPKAFKVSSGYFLEFDIFAMAFYFATRYEEYLPHATDMHQRFNAEDSYAFKHNCLHFAFVNRAIAFFKLKLKKQFPFLIYKERIFNSLSTIDIDNAYAYANKGSKRNVGGLLRDVSKFKISDVFTRIMSNINSNLDPYNTFDVIDKFNTDANIRLHYFALIGDYGQFDKNPHYQNKQFRKLLKNLSLNHTVGLHPSYTTFNDVSKIDVEIKRLEEILEHKVTSARCHFLRINFPDTYRAFVNAGITDDYTMIYASQSGFRTGLCVPYKWFDLQRNEATNLTLHPSTVMEGTLRDYNKLTPENANAFILNVITEVKKHNGEFISIWHNDSFITQQKQWIDVYTKMLNELQKSKI